MTTSPDSPASATTASSPASAAIASTTAGTSKMPDKPIMGNIIEFNKDEFVAFTGGKPNADWTGLDQPATKPHTPNCIRSTYVSNQTKDWNRRTEAPEQKFKKDDESFSLRQFELLTLAHFEDKGMDTIMYVPSILDPTKLVNIITEYEQVSLKHVQAKAAELQTKWDEYDAENDRAALIYLKRSLDPSLQRDLLEDTMTRDTAAVFWMRILRWICGAI